MRRREAIIAGGTATAALAGCIGDTTNSDNPGDDDNGNPNGNDNSSGETRTVTVRGAGEVMTEPDMASFSVAVEVEGDDAGDVRDEVQERVDEVKDALVDAGVDEDDITSRRFWVREYVEEAPREPTEEDDDEPREVVRYMGMHDLEVEVYDIDELGTIVDAAIDAGASRVSRINFGLSDEARDELRDDALEEAIGAAIDEADFIAGEVDAEMVEVKHVDAAGTSVSRTYLEADVAEDDGGTSFQPDDVTVSASVELVAIIE